MNRMLPLGLAIVLGLFVATNAILLFSNESQFTRSYYVKDYDRVQENTFTQKLEKETIVVPANEITVSIKEDIVANMTVKPGDIVEQGGELAQVKTETADKQRSLWEAEQQAYTLEQTHLQQIIDTLKMERAQATSITETTSITGAEQTSDVQVNVFQDSNFAQAIANVEQQLAEVERNIQLVNTQLSQPSSDLALLSPTDGTIANIEKRDSAYFITLYAKEKSVITFANEAQWHEIEVGQNVWNHSNHREGMMEGTILEKSAVPTNNSNWLQTYEQQTNKAEEPLYEVRIQLNDPLDDLPYGSNTTAIITTKHVEHAVRVHSNWLLDRSKQTATIYMLNKEGRIVRTPVTSAYDVSQYTILSEGLKSGTVVLNTETIREQSPAFLPFPLDLPTWSSIKAVSWKDYMRYLTYF